MAPTKVFGCWRPSESPVFVLAAVVFAIGRSFLRPWSQERLAGAKRLLTSILFFVFCESEISAQHAILVFFWGFPDRTPWIFRVNAPPFVFRVGTCHVGDGPCSFSRNVRGSKKKSSGVMGLSLP